MSVNEDRLVIAISSRALFDLSESHRLFTEQGTQAYHEYQISHENEVLKPGVAFPLAQKLLALNTPSQRYVEVILMSRNSADTGLRIFNSIQHYNLDISRAAFTRGAPTSRYVAAFGAHLFLSADSEEVRKVLADGYAAATIFPGAGQTMPGDSSHLRIAFDGDAVLFSDESEQIYQKEGLNAFAAHEQASAHQPLTGGPFKNFLAALHRIQASFPEEELPLRTALLTARAAPAHERVVRTLRAWNIRIDEAFFLGGLDKTEFLKMFGADIFFDDQLTHCNAAAPHIATAHVPHGITNHVAPAPQPHQPAAAPLQQPMAPIQTHSAPLPTFAATQPIVDGMAPTPSISVNTAQEHPAAPQQPDKVWLFDEKHPTLAPHEPTHQQLPLPTPTQTAPTTSPFQAMPATSPFELSYPMESLAQTAPTKPVVEQPLTLNPFEPFTPAVENHFTPVIEKPFAPEVEKPFAPDFVHEIEMPTFSAPSNISNTPQHSPFNIQFDDPITPSQPSTTAPAKQYAHDPLLDDQPSYQQPSSQHEPLQQHIAEPFQQPYHAPQQPSTTHANTIPFNNETATHAVAPTPVKNSEPPAEHVLSTEEILRRFARKMTENTHKAGVPSQQPTQSTTASPAPRPRQTDDVFAMSTENISYDAPPSASPFQTQENIAAPKPSSNPFNANPFAIMKDKEGS